MEVLYLLSYRSLKIIDYVVRTLPWKYSSSLRDAVTSFRYQSLGFFYCLFVLCDEFHYTEERLYFKIIKNEGDNSSSVIWYKNASYH